MQGHAFLDSYEHGVDAAQARTRLNSAGKAGDGAGKLFIPALIAKQCVLHGPLKRNSSDMFSYLPQVDHGPECEERPVEALVGWQRVSERDVVGELSLWRCHQCRPP